mgnify:CR=1 FL=1|tara:strand:- start:21093 stop:21419 length:327 start_codon:yes stop_codon:yes gene_type:complete
MVAIVYKRKYDTRGMEHEVLMKLKDDFSGACRISDFYRGETAYGRDNIYEDELTIGSEGYDHIVIRGQVIHNIVKSVMRGVSKKAKQDMIEHLKYLIEEGEHLKSNKG